MFPFTGPGNFFLRFQDHNHRDVLTTSKPSSSDILVFNSVVNFCFFLTRDRPFISVVRAPRVILLVHNDQPDKTRTHILITTIANAWPMLVFILVTASLSGIIIWFLVSRAVFASSCFKHVFLKHVRLSVAFLLPGSHLKG